jgi:hypothetical protein
MVAVVAAFQIRVVFNCTFLALSTGAARDGGSGAETTVVKLLTIDQELVPPELFAFIRQ